MKHQHLLYLSGAAIIFSAGSFALSMEKVEHSNVEATMHVETIVLGSGCFWGAEKRYEALNGVIDAELSVLRQTEYFAIGHAVTRMV